MALSLGVLVAATAAPIGAQFPARVAPGVRVRVMLPDSARQVPLGPRGQFVVGTVARTTADTLYVVISSATGTVGIARRTMRSLAVSRGVPSRGLSALEQGGRSALLGALDFAVLQGVKRDDRPFDSTGEAVLVGAAVGFGVGAIIGAISPAERWHRVRLGR